MDTKNVQRVIETYVRPWRPQADALRGQVVVIDANGGGAHDAAQRRLDDLSLMTAGVLFHFTQQAGGIPIMTRADDNPSRDCKGAESNDVVVDITFSQSEPSDNTQFTCTVQARIGSTQSSPLESAIVDAFHTIDALPDVSLRANSAPTGIAITATAAEACEVKTRLIPQKVAEAVCRGMIAFVQKQAAATPHASPSATPVPRFVDRTPEQEMQETAERVWPHGKLPIEYAAWFCDTFVRTVFSDRTFVYCQPNVTVEGDTVRIAGATNVALLRDTFADALRCVGIENVINELRLLPEDGALNGERFAVCLASMALTYAAPSESAGLRSQLLYGEPVLLLDHKDGFLLVHGDDGYWGWVREERLRILTAADFAPYTATRRAVLQRDIDLGGRRIPRGAVLPIAREADARMLLTHPHDDPLEVGARDVRIQDASRNGEARISAALELLHVPYIYGGVSPIGLDCSGLAQKSSLRSGLALPRDAGQQFLSGRLVATRWNPDAIAPGDLLYFINNCGRIYHVGVAITPTHFMHSGPPEVRIDSLQEGDRLYSVERARTFLAARRFG
ncbi:MAG: C40 family peptidase [Phycisphaerales bacterium]|nr:C40 family peptidase [Phycisphaerales bacterium]